MLARVGMALAALAVGAATWTGLALERAQTSPAEGGASDLLSAPPVSGFDGRLYADPETGCIEVYRAPDDEEPAVRRVPEASPELLRRPWPRCERIPLQPGSAPAAPPGP
jgi:hypothetical protein